MGKPERSVEGQKVGDDGQKTGDAVVRVTRTLEAPIERAFQMFAERMDAWWPRAYHLGATERTDLILEPHVGGRWYERTADGEECDWGNVLVWDPPNHLVLSWQIGVGFVPESDPEQASRVDVRFVEEGSTRTTVTLVHSNFERHGEGWESMRDGVSREGGWPDILEAYTNVVGESSPPHEEARPQSKATPASDEPSSPDNTEEPVLVRVTRRFAASPERVFDAFLDSDRAGRFMFAAESGQMVHVEIDARVGGSFAFVDRRDGEDVAHTGTYLEIDRPRRLVFTLSVDESAADRVIVDIVPQKTGCELTLTHEMDPEWAEYASRTEEGWSGILDGLAATLGNGEGRLPVPSNNGEREPANHAEHTIRMVRILDAPIDEVYAAWTDPAVMRRWMGTTVEADVRVGGRYRIENEADEGEVYVHTGEYLVLEPGRRVVQTFRAGRTEPDPNEPSPFVNEFVEVRLRPLGPSQTELTLTNGWDGKGMDEEEQEAAKEGWASWLDLLEGLFS